MRPAMASLVIGGSAKRPNCSSDASAWSRRLAGRFEGLCRCHLKNLKRLTNLVACFRSALALRRMLIVEVGQTVWLFADFAQSERFQSTRVQASAHPQE